VRASGYGDADEWSAKESVVVPLKSVILIIWGVFWLYWLIAAVGAKEGTRSRRWRIPGLLLILVVIVERVFGRHGEPAHSVAFQVVGMIVFLSGLALAVWARVYLGRNWGMPMTRKAEPELVTTGPYKYVRHPIYSGLLLGVLGTALAVNIYWLIALVLAGAYFIYSARIEEGLMESAFPTTYDDYKSKTKMLIPFVL
jgi:protein-S-isoprenylcysteine O-methyltransferase Ste14